jgi:hypothetical protein
LAASLVTVEGNYLYVACSYAGFQVVDITDPTNPVLVGGDTTPGLSYDVKISGDYAYLTGANSGFHVYDVHDPTNPTLLYTVDTVGNPLGVAVAGDYAYVADGTGLQVVEVFGRRFDIQSNVGQSLAIDESDEQVLKARLITTQVDSICWELSADGGSNWEEVLPDNTWHSFAYPGNDLLWRSTHVLIDAHTNPTCTSLSIEWELLPAFGLDIQPRSCPNPLNVKPFLDPPKNAISKKGGILPVAILGSDQLDVYDIDVSTLLLAGVTPLRHDYDDVAAPVVDGDECECTTAGPDGYTDLTLKFRKRDIAAALGPVADGDIITLTIGGFLNSGMEILGTDCVIIRSEHLPEPISGGQLVLGPAVPNPFNPVTQISYILPKEDFVRLSVYDVSGKLVDRLVSEFQSAGEYVVEWNAHRMASGIYFYRIEVGDVVETRKMILLK